VSIARAVERRGRRAATIDLDLMYEMLAREHVRKDDVVSWGRARRAAGALAQAFLDDGTDVVVAEGNFLEEEGRAEFVSLLRADTTVRFVTLTAPLAAALVRVERDPTRGLSRDRAFLARHYDEVAELLRRRPDGDLCLDTGELTLEQATRAVVDWVI
jgi:hypothetical protein